jgi:hypothetical protein
MASPTCTWSRSTSAVKRELADGGRIESRRSACGQGHHFEGDRIRLQVLAAQGGPEEVHPRDVGFERRDAELAGPQAENRLAHERRRQVHAAV